MDQRTGAKTRRRSDAQSSRERDGGGVWGGVVADGAAVLRTPSAQRPSKLEALPLALLAELDLWWALTALRGFGEDGRAKPSA